MTSIRYHRPRTVAEACDLLAKFGPGARILAGGTALGILMKERLVDLEHIVSLESTSLDGVAWADGVLRVGAMATHQALTDHPTVRARLPILAEVLGQVASRRIRNVATLGGNLCWAEAASDPPGLLVALDASVVVQSVRGTRHLLVRDLFADYFTTALALDEVLTEVLIPAANGAGIAYLKFAPQSRADKPVLGVTARVERDGDAWGGGRVVVTAAGPRPLSLPVVDARLRGIRGGDEDAMVHVAEGYAAAAEPVSDTRGSAAYKRRMIGVLVRRALREAWRRAGGRP
jgi:carbon-monoxide dehydrogenase medium subunit